MKQSRFMIAFMFIVIATFFTTVASAKDQPTTVQLTADAAHVSVDLVKVASAWKDVETGGSVFPANGTIPVATVGQNLTAVFVSGDVFPAGTWISARVTRTNAGSILLESYILPGDARVNIQLWGGFFPYSWSNGDTRFEVVMVNPNDGRISYVSSSVNFNGLVSPLTNADVSVSTDGSMVTIRGEFPDTPHVSIEGVPINGVMCTFSANTGKVVTVQIPMPNYGRRDYKLTLCSWGECSTMHVYRPVSTFVTIPGSPAGIKK